MSIESRLTNWLQKRPGEVLTQADLAEACDLTPKQVVDGMNRVLRKPYWHPRITVIAGGQQWRFDPDIQTRLPLVTVPDKERPWAGPLPPIVNGDTTRTIRVVAEQGDKLLLMVNNTLYAAEKHLL